MPWGCRGHRVDGRWCAGEEAEFNLGHVLPVLTLQLVVFCGMWQQWTTVRTCAYTLQVQQLAEQLAVLYKRHQGPGVQGDGGGALRMASEEQARCASNCAVLC